MTRIYDTLSKKGLVKVYAENLSNGACQVPAYTDNGDGSITVATGCYNLSANADGSGLITQYTIAGGTFTLTDGSNNYVVADYNGGTPIVKVILDVALINETTIVPVYTIFRSGIVLHTQNWDSLGLALVNKIHQSIVKTQRYRRESGLALSEYGTRNLNLTTGKVWIGAVPITLDAIATATDNIFFYKHVAGVWTLDATVTAYNNTQYDNGTNLVTLSGAGTQYAVNWVFRGVENQKHLYVVLGTGNYSLAQAQSATVPAIPVTISSHAVLVGKVIVAQNASTATSIQSAFDVQFSMSTPSDHNNLVNLQGGQASEYYHLIASKYTKINIGTDIIYPDMLLDGTVPPETYELLVNTGVVPIRKFSGTVDQDVNIAWQPPYEISSNIVQFRVVMMLTEATAPANGETIIFKLAGCALLDSDNLNKALGTAVGVTYTAPASGLVQFDKIATGWSGDVTITDLATLLPVKLNLLRDTANDTYAQKIGVAYVEVRYSNT